MRITNIQLKQLIKEEVATFFESNQAMDYSAELHKITGPDFVIEFEFVDEIKLTDSGKRRVTISRI